MTTIGIARSLVSTVTKPRSMEQRVGGWTASLDLSLTNWTVGVLFDVPPAVGRISASILDR
jgi:hypothetical protein